MEIERESVSGGKPQMMFRRDNLPEPLGRATTDIQKEEVMERLLTLWKLHPRLRLGQLILSSYRFDPYYIEDFDLVKNLEMFYAEYPDAGTR